MKAKPLTCELEGSEIVLNDDLRISFRRTIRVPDNHQVSSLPPDMGAYPLKAVAEYKRGLPPAMTSKGGLFFPMYQSEAMWIKFECERQQSYMIKIYVGGINAISGEPAVENADTKLRRQACMARPKVEDMEASPLQDYVVVPGQEWLDGIADSNGTIRQFVAMPFGSGYSVESQITGKDAAAGIQFEVTPYEVQPERRLGSMVICVETLTGMTFDLCAEATDTVEFTKQLIRDKTGFSCDQQRLVFGGKLLQDSRTLADYNITRGSVLHLVPTLRGGGPGPEMTVAVGGYIRQTIVRDMLGQQWQRDRTTVFNVQILDSAAYQAVTGEAPPTKPIDVETYRRLGFPFFHMYEEPSGISGDFGMVKSVAQINGADEDVVTPDVVEIAGTAAELPVGLVNPNGPLREFRTVGDLAEEYGGCHFVDF